MRLLLVGRTGLLGGELEQLLRPGYEVWAIGRDTLDLSTDPSGWREFRTGLRDFSPVYALICAAASVVDDCERDPAGTARVNVEGTQRLLDELRSRRIIPIFFSTDYVFDGQVGNYAETDPVSPVTNYGEQKLATENYIRSNFREYLIFRSSNLLSFRPTPRNTLNWIRHRLMESEGLKAPVDQWLTPTFTDDIGEILDRALQVKLSGLYHLGTPEPVTRYELAVGVALALGLDEKRVVGCRLTELASVSRRPAFKTLDSSRIQAALQFKFTDLSEGVREFARQCTGRGRAI